MDGHLGCLLLCYYKERRDGRVRRPVGLQKQAASGAKRTDTFAKVHPADEWTRMLVSSYPSSTPLSLLIS